MLKISDNETQDKLNANRKNKTIFYDCTCKACGEIFSTAKQNIGKIKSCGCSRNKWKQRAPDYIGKKYNRLTIIGIDEERTKAVYADKTNKISDIYVWCECECGTKSEKSLRLNSIKYGHIKSCGCIKFNNPLIIEDLTGKTFNRLTVVSRDIERDTKREKGSNAHWLCQCSCGNPELKSVTGWQLKSGKTKSCGCYNSEIIAERNKLMSPKFNRPESYKDNTVISNNDGTLRLYDENDNSFIIDAEDYGIVKKWYWRKDIRGDNPNKWYWVTNSKISDIGRSSLIKLHQIIAEIKYGEYDHNTLVPDHLSRNPDDNRKCNLKLKTILENSHNRKLSNKNTSGKTGVSWDKNKNKWVAYIMFNYKHKYLGAYENYDEAVDIRKEAEIKYGFTCDDVLPEYDMETVT